MLLLLAIRYFYKASGYEIIKLRAVPVVTPFRLVPGSVPVPFGTII